MGLLKGIDPLLTADLLYVLRSMGHGDKLVVCDCNFPAAQIATKTTSGKCIVLPVPLPEVLSSILTVLPLDYFCEKPVSVMAPSVGLSLPPEAVEIHNEIEKAVEAATSDLKVFPLERFSFYDEAKTCYAVVQTLERRPYANVVLQKGVVGPNGQDLKP